MTDLSWKEEPSPRTMAADSVRSRLWCCKNNLGLQTVKTSRFPKVCAATKNQDMIFLMLSSRIVRVCDAAVPPSGTGTRFMLDMQKEMRATPHPVTQTVNLAVLVPSRLFPTSKQVVFSDLLKNLSNRVRTSSPRWMKDSERWTLQCWWWWRYRDLYIIFPQSGPCFYCEAHL